MDYSTLTEKELNLKVNLVMLEKQFPKAKSMQYDEQQNCVWVESIGFSSYEIKDYCHGSIESWKIIDSVWSTLQSVIKYDSGLGLGETDMTIWSAHMIEYSCEPAIAACIVFLKEYENDKK